MYPFVRPNLFICIIFCGCLFIDWLIQYLKIQESTNIRRLITGILCGYGMLSLEVVIAVKIIRFLIGI